MAQLVAPRASYAQRHGWSERPIDESWRVTRSWDARTEREFGAFVTAIGRAVAAHRCRSLNDCLNNPAINPLHEGGRPLAFRADCADVAYLTRAYFAYRRGLPFGFTSRVRWNHDPSAPHGLDVVPIAWQRWRDYETPWRLLHDMVSVVHSGFFRTRPDSEEGDWYPARIDRNGVHPGTVFYDPDGHVLVVYEVGDDGEVRLFDGHPGGSISARRLDPTVTPGSARLGGGFLNFRPVRWTGASLVRAHNAELADRDPTMQYNRSLRVLDGRPVLFDAWVRARLAR